MDVKDKLIERKVVKNKSLSVSTQKVRNSSKNLEERGIFLKNKEKITSNEERLHTRYKTEFISEIYCPKKKKSSKKINDIQKQKNKKSELDIEIGSLFWRKKSSVSKATQGTFG